MRVAFTAVMLAAGLLMPGSPVSDSAIAAQRGGDLVPRTPEQWLEWMAAHRDQTGLVAYVPGRQAAGVRHAPGGRFPLASTRKVLILGAYAEQIAAGGLDPAKRVRLGEIERWYWPGTDGGAHPAAVQEWRDRGKLQGEGPSATVALDDVALAMIKQSDNAAADYLLMRVGRGAPDAFARRHGMKSQDPVWPLFGEWVAMAKVPAGVWTRLAPKRRAALAWALARTPREVATRLPLPGPRTQARIAAASAAGTPAEWARLMQRLHAGTGLSPRAHAVTRRILEWAIADVPDVAREFTRFGFKGGSLAGVLTMASYLKPKGDDPMVVTVFVRGLPPEAPTDPRVAQAFFGFTLKLAVDPGFFATVRDRLGEP